MNVVHVMVLVEASSSPPSSKYSSSSVASTSNIVSAFALFFMSKIYKDHVTKLEWKLSPDPFNFGSFGFQSKKGFPPVFSKLLGCDDNPVTSYNEDDGDKKDEQGRGNQVTAKLLVPSNLIGCVIKTGSQIVQSIRNETGAQIRILKDERLPHCALGSNELVQISGETTTVTKQICGTNGRVTVERSHYFVDIQLVHQ